MIILIFIVIITLEIVYLYWSNTSVQTTDIIIENDKVHEFTIAHISDLHNNEFGENQKVLIKKISDAVPDIIAVTGDLIDSYQPDINIAVNFIKEAVKIAPVYYVPGNHESRIPEQYEDAKQQMTDAGAVVLEDDYFVYMHGNETINILGVKDPSFSAQSHKSDSELMTEKLKNLMKEKTGFTLLLSHRPELLEIYAQENIYLVLSGHAHGGQVRLPFIKGIIAPNQGFFPKYTSGLYKSNNTNMVVSRGLGSSIVPLRINNRPEIVIITLK